MDFNPDFHSPSHSFDHHPGVSDEYLPSYGPNMGTGNAQGPLTSPREWRALLIKLGIIGVILIGIGILMVMYLASSKQADPYQMQFPESMRDFSNTLLAPTPIP